MAQDTNGGKAQMIIGLVSKGVMTILITGTLALAGWVRNQDQTQTQLQQDYRALEATVIRIKSEGTDICKAHTIGDIGLRSDVQHMQEIQQEVRADVKKVQSDIAQQKVDMQTILTKLEILVDKE